MAKIVFNVGTMSSGKTTHLLQTHFNIDAAFPGEVLLLTKNDRSGKCVCSSRTGNATIAVNVDDDSSIMEILEKEENDRRHHIKYLFLDEVQFLNTPQIDELAYIADVRGVEIHAYGLLTTYKGTMFPASKRLLELADSFFQLNNNMRCWCGKPATHNALYTNGKRTFDGADEIVDNNTVVAYKVMCRKHFLDHVDYQSNHE